jgi:hypothetical protein
MHFMSKLARALFAACCGLLVVPGGASAQGGATSRTLERVGGWEAYVSALDDGRLVCGLDTSGSHQRYFTMRVVNGQTVIRVRASKKSWAIPRGTRVPVVLRIDGLPGWEATAAGAGESLEWHIGLDIMSRFEREFRGGLRMILLFPNGNEEAWSFNLNGTNRIMTAFVRCLDAVTEATRGPTQPHGAAPTSPSTGTAPSQPFASPTQPAAPAPGGRRL